MFFPDSKTFLELSIGSYNFSVKWYAVLILIGAMLTYLVQKKEFKECKYKDTDFFDSLFVYTLWIGIIGARLWFCVFYNFSFYMQYPTQIIRIWDGGLAIQGGVVFGLVFVYFYCKAKNYSFLKMLDILLPNVLIGQAIGRWGNFVNQECHGGEVAEAYFTGILSFLKEGMYINGHYYEPLFFYESMLCILGWLIIHFLLKRVQNNRGDLAYAYFMWYGLIRFFIEQKRTDSLYLGNIKMAQLTSMLFLLIGIFGYLGSYKKFTKEKKPTIIFDFDGTIIDTKDSILAGYRACFKKYSKLSNFTKQVQAEVIGPPLFEMFPKYFPSVDFNTLVELFHNEQFKVSKKKNKVTPHTKEVLKYLSSNGYNLAIVSTRDHHGVERLLKENGLNKYFNFIVGIDDVSKTKPDPESIIYVVEKNKWNKDVIYIGDTMMDIECGNNYGAYTVAYLNNPEVSQTMAANSNDAITDMNQLLPIIERNISFTYNQR